MVMIALQILGCSWIPIHAFILQVASTKNIHDKAQSELDLIRMKMKECDSQISSILKEQQKLQHKLSETSLERKKMENEVIYLLLVLDNYSTQSLINPFFKTYFR